MQVLDEAFRIIMFYTFTDDEIHTILFSLLKLEVNVDQAELIDKIKIQIERNRFKDAIRRAG
jgi:hypothetical protein